MLKTPNNPVARRVRFSTASVRLLQANRRSFFLDVASGPFYGFNRPGAKVSQGTIENWCGRA